MAEQKVPYVPSYGQITKVLKKIQAASTPDRFTQDYLATTLDMKGGGPKPVIPYLKRTGFLGSDGSPTDLYQRFRNKSKSGTAARQALKTGYKALYDINEFVHDAKDDELKGIVVQATGLDEKSGTVGKITGSFKALRAFATFDEDSPEDEKPEDVGDGGGGDGPGLSQLNLGYTINLHLPATSDIAVFNAIFKSLREQLLK